MSTVPSFPAPSACALRGSPTSPTPTPCCDADATTSCSCSGSECCYDVDSRATPVAVCHEEDCSQCGANDDEPTETGADRLPTPPRTPAALGLIANSTAMLLKADGTLQHPATTFEGAMLSHTDSIGGGVGGGAKAKAAVAACGGASQASSFDDMIAMGSPLTHSLSASSSTAKQVHHVTKASLRKAIREGGANTHHHHHHHHHHSLFHVRGGLEIASGGSGVIDDLLLLRTSSSNSGAGVDRSSSGSGNKIAAEVPPISSPFGGQASACESALSVASYGLSSSSASVRHNHRRHLSTSPLSPSTATPPALKVMVETCTMTSPTALGSDVLAFPPPPSSSAAPLVAVQHVTAATNTSASITDQQGEDKTAAAILMPSSPPLAPAVPTNNGTVSRRRNAEAAAAPAASGNTAATVRSAKKKHHHHHHNHHSHDNKKNTFSMEGIQTRNETWRFLKELLDSSGERDPRRGEGPRRLYNFHEVPAHLQDNEFILNYYRAYMTTAECVKSVFEIHNETGNIWTHLLGVLVYIAMFWWVQNDVIIPRQDGLEAVHRLMFTLLPLSMMACLFASAMFHTMLAHEQVWIFKLAHALDYAGATCVMTGTFIPIIYYAFVCQPLLQVGYITMACILGVTGVVAPLLPWFENDDAFFARLGIYAAIGASAGIPSLNLLFSTPLNHLTIPIYAGIFFVFFIALGAVAVYASNFPERYAPGRFDLWFNSHQIWHTLIFMGCVVQFFNVVALYQNWSIMQGHC